MDVSRFLFYVLSHCLWGLNKAHFLGLCLAWWLLAYGGRPLLITLELNLQHQLELGAQYGSARFSTVMVTSFLSPPSRALVVHSTAQSNTRISFPQRNIVKRHSFPHYLNGDVGVLYCVCVVCVCVFLCGGVLIAPAVFSASENV